MKKLLMVLILICISSSVLFLSCNSGDSNDDSKRSLDDDDIADDDDINGDDDDDDDITNMMQIPAGNFQMGCEPQDLCLGNERPKHEIYLSTYYIDVYEVTNVKYAAFLNAHGNDCEGYECADKDDPEIRVHESGGVWTADSGFEDHPMVEVSWFGANAFCAYYGGRLPTEAEWEKAAKGATEHYNYPWGDTWIPNAANYGENNDPWETGETPETNPIGYYDGSDHDGAYQTSDGRSPYGLYDMAGNVEEWVNDWFDWDYYSVSPSTDPPGPMTGTDRIARGGGWGWVPWMLRSSYRHIYEPTIMYLVIGFRCARDY